MKRIQPSLSRVGISATSSHHKKTHITWKFWTTTTKKREPKLPPPQICCSTPKTSISLDYFPLFHVIPTDQYKEKHNHPRNASVGHRHPWFQPEGGEGGEEEVYPQGNGRPIKERCLSSHWVYAPTSQLSLVEGGGANILTFSCPPQMYLPFIQCLLSEKRCHEAFWQGVHLVLLLLLVKVSSHGFFMVATLTCWIMASDDVGFLTSLVRAARETRIVVCGKNYIE